MKMNAVRIEFDAVPNSELSSTEKVFAPEHLPQSFMCLFRVRKRNPKVELILEYDFPMCDDNLPYYALEVPQNVVSAIIDELRKHDVSKLQEMLDPNDECFSLPQVDISL